jgi:hypothetical protein
MIPSDKKTLVKALPLSLSLRFSFLDSNEIFCCLAFWSLPYNPVVHYFVSLGLSRLSLRDLFITMG